MNDIVISGINLMLTGMITVFIFLATLILLINIVASLFENDITKGSINIDITKTHSDINEHKKIIEIAVKECSGKIPVIAGTGSNSTDEAVELSQYAEKAGSDALLVVTPYYNKPTQAGLTAHFTAINDAVESLPIFIYNIPVRSVIDMTVETMAALSNLSNIAGVKDATGDLNRVSLQRQACGEKFIQLSGEDGTALGFNAHGGVGCISVTANVAPTLCAEFQSACLAGDMSRALELQDRLMPLHHALFLEASPAPAKFAAAELGLCSEELRLPLVPVTEPTKKAVRQALIHAGLA